MAKRKSSDAGRIGKEGFSIADAGEEARTKILNAQIPLPPDSAFRIIIPQWGGISKSAQRPIIYKLNSLQSMLNRD